MAAPPEVTMRSFDGFWVMNKSLSDNLDPSLTLQGIPWVLRKIVNLATITMQAKQEVDDGGVTVITVDQTATGGIKGETEVRKLDWKEETNTSGFFGTSRHRSRWTDVKGQTQSAHGGPLDTYLTEGWLEELADKADEDYLQDFVINEKNGWSVEQIWGFAMVDGKRYHARKTLVKRGGKVETMRTIYDWKGKAKP